MLYKNLEPKKYSKKEIQLLEETGEFFNEFYKKVSSTSKIKYKDYESLREKGLELIKDKKQASVIITFCINILMAIQSADSSVIMISVEKENI